MITVKGEYYNCDYDRKPFSMNFRDFDGMLDFMKEHVNGNLDRSWGDYGSDTRMRNIDIGYRTELHDDRSKNTVSDDFRISRLEADDRGVRYHIWIYLIESENGIEFTTGRYTSGQEHASKRYKEWALQRTKDMYLTTYKFAD